MHRWFGQMNIPRELSVRDGVLCQWPVRELDGRRDNPYQRVHIWFAQDEAFHSSLRYRPPKGMLKINRKHSGLRRAVVKHHRKCERRLLRRDELTLRLILDRYSVEVFFNDGVQTMTMTIPTDLSASTRLPSLPRARPLWTWRSTTLPEPRA